MCVLIVVLVPSSMPPPIYLPYTCFFLLSIVLKVFRAAVHAARVKKNPGALGVSGEKGQDGNEQADNESVGDDGGEGDTPASEEAQGEDEEGVLVLGRTAMGVSCSIRVRDGLVTMYTTDRQCAVKVRAVPLPASVTRLLEEAVDVVRCLVAHTLDEEMTTA